nr:hypothetical protein [uncultured Noviherbaspirillum sp.]
MFGVTMTLIELYQGYEANRRPEGVAHTVAIGL